MAEAESRGSGPQGPSTQDIIEQVSDLGSLGLGDDLPLKPTVLSIQDLPEEVRGKIFNYVPQAEIVNVRLVCKQWDRDVGDHYLHRISGLNEDSPSFEIQVKQRISHLGIKQLRSISVLRPDGTCIFGYPTLITNLAFCRGYGQVSPSNVQSLLDLLAKTLRSLYMELTPEVFNHQFPPDLSYAFTALTHLNIQCMEADDEASPLGPSVLRVFETSSFPKLKAFGAQFLFTSRVNRAAILGSILRLVGANGKFLESLQLPNYFGSALLAPLLTAASLARLKGITQLRKFRGRLVDFGPCPEFWVEFLSSQKKLTEVALDLADLEWPDVLRYFVPSNPTGLVSIKLDSLYPRNPLDMAVFAGCTHLEKLFFGGRLGHRPNSGTLYNFHRLPSTITHLRVDDFALKSEELMAAFTLPGEEGSERSRGFPNLQILDLYYEGHFGPYEVSTEVLEKMLGSKSLLSLSVGGFDRGQHCQQRVLLATKFNIHLMGNPDDLWYFEVDRALPTAAWKESSSSRPVFNF